MRIEKQRENKGKKNRLRAKGKRAKQNDKIKKKHWWLFSLSTNLIERLEKT